MIARLIWYTALLAIAAITAAVQMDRQSAITPAFAPAVPEPVRGYAQAQIAARSLENGEGMRAVAEAKKLVERRPVPAEPLRLLAQAQIAAGQTQQGAITVQYAAQRGWRDPAAQETMLRLASAAGDNPEAARRYIALLLQAGTEDALLMEFGDELFADKNSPANETLIAILAASERWPSTFLRRGSRVLPPAAFARIVGAAAKRGATLDCAIMRDVQSPLSKRDAQAGATFAEIVAARC